MIIIKELKLELVVAPEDCAQCAAWRAAAAAPRRLGGGVKGSGIRCIQRRRLVIGIWQHMRKRCGQVVIAGLHVVP